MPSQHASVHSAPPYPPTILSLIPSRPGAPSVVGDGPPSAPAVARGPPGQTTVSSGAEVRRALSMPEWEARDPQIASIHYIRQLVLKRGF